MKRLATLGILVASLVLAGCSTGHHTVTTTHPTAQASVSAFAQHNKAQAEALVNKCFPKSATAQAKLAEPLKGKPARQAVEACLKVPAQNRAAFDHAVEQAAINGHLRTKAGRDVFPQTLADLVVQYGG